MPLTAGHHPAYSAPPGPAEAFPLPSLVQKTKAIQNRKEKKEDIWKHFILLYIIKPMGKVSEKEIQELTRQFPSALGYLTTIHLIERDKGFAGNTLLANRLGVSKPASNQAMGRLKKLKLAEQDPYGAIYLTEKGKDFASVVLKRHYLIEHLLISKLGYPWEKSDEEAQRIQTNLSQEFTNYLFQYFGKPQTCPHGNPFPGSRREKVLLKAPRLTKAFAETEIELLRITEEGEAVDGLLLFCRSHDLMPGKQLFVKEVSEHGVSVEVNGSTKLIPESIAKHLCFKELGKRKKQKEE